MLDTTTVTLYGNLATSVDFARTPNGWLRANVRVACTDRRRDRETGQFTDGATVFMGVTCWRELAENVAASLHKGDPVVVVGKLRQRSYLHADKHQVTVIEVEAELVAPDLRRGVATGFHRNARAATSEESHDPRPADPPSHQAPATPAQDRGDGPEDASTPGTPALAGELAGVGAAAAPF